MTTITDIETAIEKLPTSQVEELASWLEDHRQKRTTSPAVENWLATARDAAKPGMTTTRAMVLSRGDMPFANI